MEPSAKVAPGARPAEDVHGVVGSVDARGHAGDAVLVQVHHGELRAEVAVGRQRRVAEPHLELAARLAHHDDAPCAAGGVDDRRGRAKASKRGAGTAIFGFASRDGAQPKGAPSNAPRRAGLQADEALGAPTPGMPAIGVCPANRA